MGNVSPMFQFSQRFHVDQSLNFKYFEQGLNNINILSKFTKDKTTEFPNYWTSLSKEGLILNRDRDEDPNSVKFAFRFDQILKCSGFHPEKLKKYMNSKLEAMFGRNECCVVYVTDWNNYANTHLFCSNQKNEWQCNAEIEIFKASFYNKCIRSNISDFKAKIKHDKGFSGIQKEDFLVQARNYFVMLEAHKIDLKYVPADGNLYRVVSNFKKHIHVMMEAMTDIVKPYCKTTFIQEAKSRVKIDYKNFDGVKLTREGNKDLNYEKLQMSSFRYEDIRKEICETIYGVENSQQSDSGPTTNTTNINIDLNGNIFNETKGNSTTTNINQIIRDLKGNKTKIDIKDVYDLIKDDLGLVDKNDKSNDIESKGHLLDFDNEKSNDIESKGHLLDSNNGGKFDNNNTPNTPIYPSNNNNNTNHKDNFYFVKQSDILTKQEKVFNCSKNNNNTDNNPIFPPGHNGDIILEYDNNDWKNSMGGRTAYKDDPDYYMRFVKPIIDSIYKIKTITVPVWTRRNNTRNNTKKEKDDSIDLPYNNEFFDLADKLEESIDKRSVEELEDDKKFAKKDCHKFYDLMIIAKKSLVNKGTKNLNKEQIFSMLGNLPKYVRVLMYQNFDFCMKKLPKVEKPLRMIPQIHSLPRPKIPLLRSNYPLNKMKGPSKPEPNPNPFLTPLDQIKDKEIKDKIKQIQAGSN